MGHHGEEAEALVSPSTTRIYHGEDLGERVPKAERCPRWGGQPVVSEPPSGSVLRGVTSESSACWVQRMYLYCDSKMLCILRLGSMSSAYHLRALDMLRGRGREGRALSLCAEVKALCLKNCTALRET